MTPSAAYHYIKHFQVLGGFVTPTAAYQYDKIFNSCFGGLMTSIAAYHYIKIVEVLGGFCDAHRSLPLRQDLQLLLGRPRDAHRGLPVHQDLQLFRGLVTPTAAYHYIKFCNSWEFSRRALQLAITSRLTTTSRSSTLGRPRDAHRSLPLHQVPQLLGGLLTRTASYHYIRIFNSWEAP